ncbi:MAG: polysaccharide biosynthesis protein, partial [Chthoniobacteraceae bacterium]
MNGNIPSAILFTVLNRRWVRAFVLGGIYIVVLSFCLWLAYQLRFDFNIPNRFEPNLIEITLIVLFIKLLCLIFCNQFDGLLSYFSTPDLKRMFLACSGAAFFIAVLRIIWGLHIAPPSGVILTDYVLTFLGLCGTRLAFRHMRLRNYRKSGSKSPKLSRVAIVGAGDSGAALARDLIDKPWHGMVPVVFFDDFHHANARMHGIPIAGRPQQIQACITKFQIDEIIIAMPSAPAKRIREIVDIVRGAGLACRTVPSLGQLATGRVSVSTLRPVEIADLLGREPVEIESAAVQEIIAGRCVMVTGAGGSIGSELCRQILSFGPSKLLLVERSEPGLFVIEQELHETRNDGTVVPIVADIGNR